MSSIGDYFKQHEEQTFIIKAFLTILLIIFVKKYLSGLLLLLFLLFPIIFFLYIRMVAATEGVSTFDILKQHITFIPIMRTERDRKTEVIPWVTYGIILANVMIFYFYQSAQGTDLKYISDNLLFLPYDPKAWNVVASAFTAMFLHGSGVHLWGNMTFLWMLGTAVERRVGHLQFFLLYLITGLCGGAAFALTWFMATGEPGHSLGASGAIAGIMGIFAVRCYFKSMIFPVPILGIFSLILPISLKIRLNSLVIIGLFFLADLSGGIGQLADTASSQTGHWAHLGGMIAGMSLAAFLKLGKDAVEERHLEIGIKAAGSSVGFGGGEQSLRRVLERSPDNAEALLHLARIKSKFSASSEGAELYARAIDLHLKTDPGEAAQTFLEYWKTYQKPLAPDAMASLATIFQRLGDCDTATRCLEAVIRSTEASPAQRRKALANCALMLDKMGFEDAAKGCYEDLVREFPHCDEAERAYARLGRKRPETASETDQNQKPTASALQPEVRITPAAPQYERKNCPACNTEMRQQRAGKGHHAGKLFWVCSDYPRCPKVIPVAE